LGPRGQGADLVHAGIIARRSGNVEVASQAATVRSQRRLLSVPPTTAFDPTRTSGDVRSHSGHHDALIRGSLLHEYTPQRDEHQVWVEIDHIRDRIAAEELHTVDAAVAFASAKGRLSIGGVPAHSVLLNRAAP
jgi:hypothetical protein